MNCCVSFKFSPTWWSSASCQRHHLWGSFPQLRLPVDDPTQPQWPPCPCLVPPCCGVPQTVRPGHARSTSIPQPVIPLCLHMRWHLQEPHLLLVRRLTRRSVRLTDLTLPEGLSGPFGLRCHPRRLTIEFQTLSHSIGIICRRLGFSMASTVLTITRRCLTHGHVVSVVSVVCLLPSSRVATISSVGHVTVVFMSVLSNQSGWRWCWFLSWPTPDDAILCAPSETLQFTEKSRIMSTKRLQSSNCSREHPTSRREDDVFVRRLAPSNADTFDKNCVTLLPSLTSLQSTMCWLGNPDENDFRERYHLMSLMLATGLLVRCHPVALVLVSTDLPARHDARAMPRSVCPHQKRHHCRSASGSPHFVPPLIG